MAVAIPLSASARSATGARGQRRRLRVVPQAAAPAAVCGPSPSPAMDFQQAASFDDLLEANLRYLRGEGLHDSPFHHGPLAAETAPLISGLARLHTQLRMFTFESQPGLVHARWVGFSESVIGSGSDGGSGRASSASSASSEASGDGGTSGGSAGEAWWVTEQVRCHARRGRFRCVCACWRAIHCCCTELGSLHP